MVDKKLSEFSAVQASEVSDLVVLFLDGNNTIKNGRMAFQSFVSMLAMLSGNNTFTGDNTFSGDAVFSGNTTFNQTVNANVSGSSGSCTGNSATATKATQDGSGNNIVNTYANKTELTGKVDLNLNNMNPSATTKTTIVGWGMPDYSSAVDAGTGHTSYANAYVVPNTGFVSIRLKISTTSGDILVNNVVVASGGFDGASGLTVGSLIPVSKNDKIHVNNNYGSMKFYPLKGISNA